MITRIPHLIGALKSSPCAKILGRYCGADWTEYLVPHNRPASVDIVSVDNWFLTIHQWPPLVDMQVPWWQHYKHSMMPLYSALMLDNVALAQFNVRTLDFQAPQITSQLMERNYSLHLFERSIQDSKAKK